MTGYSSAFFASAGLIATLLAVMAAPPAGQAAPTSAAEKRAKLSAPAPVNPRQTGNNTFQFALGNGMQVLVIPDHRAPVATQMLWFKVGAVDDPPGLSGMAHFFEHMMFRGTKQVPDDSFSQIIAKNGGDDNAFTDHDYTAFYEQIAKDRLPLAMKLEADRLANLDLSDSHVGPERDVVLEERRMRVDNEPQSLMSEQMQAALHLSHPYGRPVIGWAEEVRRIDRASAQDFYDHHYAPNNAILVIAGDVTPDEVRKMAQDAYGKVPARELAPRAEFAEPPRMAETRMVITRPDAKVPLFNRIYRVPSYAQGMRGQAEGLETFAQLLGGDQTSVLYRVLVEQKKLATDAGANYDGDVRDAGEFSVYAVPRPGVSLEALEKAVDQVLSVSAIALPRDVELNRAKTQLIASVTYRRDSQFALASAYGQALAIGLTVDDVNEWPGRIRAVTAEGVRKAAQTLQRKQAVTAYLIPGSER
ncbi:MAG TPA: pitrilysin family protein [Rhizomicrobium sp.]|nr:pitrilysin family protein [Rhizomicrobium sp.]